MTNDASKREGTGREHELLSDAWEEEVLRILHQYWWNQPGTWRDAEGERRMRRMCIHNQNTSSEECLGGPLTSAQVRGLGRDSAISEPLRVTLEDWRATEPRTVTRHWSSEELEEILEVLGRMEPWD